MSTIHLLDWRAWRSVVLHGTIQSVPFYEWYWSTQWNVTSSHGLHISPIGTGTMRYLHLIRSHFTNWMATYPANCGCDTAAGRMQYVLVLIYWIWPRQGCVLPYGSNTAWTSIPGWENSKYWESSPSWNSRYTKWTYNGPTSSLFSLATVFQPSRTPIRKT